MDQKDAKYVGFFLNLELRKKVKIEACQRNMSMSFLLRKILEDHFAKREAEKGE